MPNDSKRLVIGRIVGIYGIKGWLRIRSYTRPRENILRYSPWQLRGKDIDQTLEVREGRVQGKGMIVALAGITDPDQARRLLQADIVIDRAQLQAPAEGEYYWHDLLGAEVYNQHAELLGQATEILETGSNDVLVVEGENRHLIPLIEPEYISEIDIEGRIIRVVWDL